MVRSKDDIIWKAVLEEVFEDLLRFIYPEADQVFDLTQPVDFLDKELSELYPEPEETNDNRFVDKLVRVRLRGGGRQWILCHVEVQKKNEKDFARRMFTYFYRVHDRYNCPITAIAIATGRYGHNLPQSYIFESLGTELRYKYNKICIRSFSDKELMANKNPFSLIVLAAKKALLTGKDLEEMLLKEKVAIAGLLLKRGYSQQKTNAILRFLNNCIRFKNPETYITFEKEIDQLTSKTNTMGMKEADLEIRRIEAEEALEKGFRKGRMKEKALFVERLLEMYEMSDTEIADVADVTEAFVKRLRKRVEK